MWRRVMRGCMNVTSCLRVILAQCELSVHHHHDYVASVTRSCGCNRGAACPFSVWGAKQQTDVRVIHLRHLSVWVFHVGALAVASRRHDLPCLCRCLKYSDKWGLYGSVTTGTVLSFACALLHYIGSLLSADAMGGHGRYSIVLIGQCLGAIGQPFFTNAPAKLAGTWFPTSEREIATTIAAMLNPIGTFLAAVHHPSPTWHPAPALRVHCCCMNCLVKGSELGS